MKSYTHYLKSHWHLFSIMFLVLGNVMVIATIAFAATYPKKACAKAVPYYDGADHTDNPTICTTNDKGECKGDCSGTKRSRWVSGQCTIDNPESTCTTSTVKKKTYEYTLSCHSHDTTGRCGCWAKTNKNTEQEIEIIDC